MRHSATPINSQNKDQLNSSFSLKEEKNENPNELSQTSNCMNPRTLLNDNNNNHHIGQFTQIERNNLLSPSILRKCSYEEIPEKQSSLDNCISCFHETSVNPTFNNENFMYINTDNQLNFEPHSFIQHPNINTNTNYPNIISINNNNNNNNQSLWSDVFQDNLQLFSSDQGGWVGEYQRNNNYQELRTMNNINNMNDNNINNYNTKPLEYFLDSNQNDNLSLTDNQQQQTLSSDQVSSYVHFYHQQNKNNLLPQLKLNSNNFENQNFYAEQQQQITNFENIKKQQQYQPSDQDELLINQPLFKQNSSSLYNNIIDEDSHSKSQLSDEQYLLNFTFPDLPSSSSSQVYNHQKKMQNSIVFSDIPNNILSNSHDISGSSIVLDPLNKLEFQKKNEERLENQGDLEYKEDIFFQQLNNCQQNNDPKNKFTNLDKKQINLTDSLKSNEKIPQQSSLTQIINEQKIQENNNKEEKHKQFQSLLSIFFPKQSKQNETNKNDSQAATEIYQLDKKNIVRNLIRAFIRYFFHKTEFSIIHQQYFQNQNQNDTKSQFKKYFTKKKFNNQVIKQLVLHDNYGQIFLNFLSTEAINYLQHSNVKCKENHEKFIKFLIKCYDNPELLENLETYSKNKKY